MTARVLVVAVVMAGCGLPGAPVKGQPCMQGDESECMTTTSLGVCDTVAGTWFEWRCDGRCSNAQKPQCKIAPSKLGDPCPLYVEGSATCASATSLLKCEAGRFVEGGSCPNCRAENGFIQCN